MAEQEGRIYHGAPPQSIVTLHPRFELLLFTLRACYVSVSGTPDTDDDDWSAGGKSTTAPKFVWNSNRITLENTVTIDKPLGDIYRFGVAAFCPNESYHFWLVTVIVSMVS
uniref:Uncharacterized protein n=1 Tax=Romanomermis culicivorax TaxID=13658 RepID=A0A915KZU4_ROMCU